MTHALPDPAARNEFYSVTAFGKRYEASFFHGKPRYVYTPVNGGRGLGRKRLIWDGYAGHPLRGRAAKIIAYVLNPGEAAKAGVHVEDSEMRKVRVAKEEAELAAKQAARRATQQAEDAARERLARLQRAAPNLLIALEALVRGPKISAWLREHDPELLAEARAAIAAAKEEA